MHSDLAALDRVRVRLPSVGTPAACRLPAPHGGALECESGGLRLWRSKLSLSCETPQAAGSFRARGTVELGQRIAGLFVRQHRPQSDSSPRLCRGHPLSHSKVRCADRYVAARLRTGRMLRKPGRLRKRQLAAALPRTSALALQSPLRGPVCGSKAAYGQDSRETSQIKKASGNSPLVETAGKTPFALATIPNA
jgi:hypothetical protein